MQRSFLITRTSYSSRYLVCRASCPGSSDDFFKRVQNHVSSKRKTVESRRHQQQKLVKEWIDDEIRLAKELVRFDKDKDNDDKENDRDNKGIITDTEDDDDTYETSMPVDNKKK